MNEYLVDFRDIQFCLYEHLEFEKLLKFTAYQGLKKETFDLMLKEALKQVKEILAPLNSLGDRKEITFEDGRVKLLPEIVGAFRLLADSGYAGILADPEWGGQGLPEVFGAVGGEFFNGASTSICNTIGMTTGAANLIRNFGSGDMKTIYLEKMYAGKWAGTMCLTESHAGSALGDLSCKAVKDGNHYKIIGTKNFVSGGDHNLTENIVHMVLARTEGAPRGIKGISLFLVPKFLVNPDGSPGELNDIHVTGLVKKMGFRASPTCILSFGDKNNCKGYLIGDECQGIRYMFQMMNESRILIGLQSLGISGTAFLHALRYAQDRIQGTEIMKMMDADAPQVPIIHHPDVRRMLLMMKSVTEGMRALIYSTAFYKDLSKLEENPEKREFYKDFVDLFTPVCKAWSSDMGFRVCEWAMQCYGGYGYCCDYPVEQYLRDIKVSSIFEGTNGIQALDLLARKVPRKNGRLFMNFISMLNEFIEKHKSHSKQGKNIARLEKAKDALVHVTGMFGDIMADGDISYPLIHACPYLEMFGDVAVAHLLLEQSLIAQKKFDHICKDRSADSEDEKKKICIENREARFYWGKICSADFFVIKDRE
ncbi:MAG: acyl-CoA dehydrogenase [Desulfobacteraceae bacterium]|nr:acyl-CoA dehydrogenase [Desulfobacteraceae bacterium]MBC2755472.1 acyl-CoA dehydrogenase [Desulfobacteraceae bacterium]